MERATRIELATFCLGSKRSTAELRPLGRTTYSVDTGTLHSPLARRDDFALFPLTTF